MFFFDSFIITQRTFYMTLGFIVLFLATVINFACSGLFKKNSQKFSNITLCSALILSSLCLLPFVLGFLNPHSTSSIYFFNKNIAFGGLEIFLCIISQLTILAAFLISKKQSDKLRFKQHYFNSLYLCSAMALNFLIISKGFIPFILSLETISICTFFIIQGFKNRNIFFSAYKYFLMSFTATAVMVFAYALLCGFSAQSGLAPVAAKALFIGGLLAKCGFSVIFQHEKQTENKDSYPAFVFSNLAVLLTYSVSLHKVVHDFFETGSLVQIFFTLLLPLCCLIGACKTLRAKNYKDFVFYLNCTNFCTIAFLFFIQNTFVHSSSLLLLINVLISNLALLSAGEIFYVNKDSNMDYGDFKGVSYTNANYCNLLSIAVFISVSIIPAGIFASRFFASAALSQTGLWSSVVFFVYSLAYAILIASAIKFTAVFYQKPNNGKHFKNKTFKKRTNICYSILLMSIILSIAMIILSSKTAALIIEIL